MSDRPGSTDRSGHHPPPGSRGIDDLLAVARARLSRLDPEVGHLAHRRGAVLVDIRPAAQRAATGQVPGALLVERNVLEWRFDPRSAARLPVADRYDLPVVILCQEGYTSSLAAAALMDLGLRRATDVVGGFAAWRAAGLPTFPPVGPGPVTADPPRYAGPPSLPTTRPAGAGSSIRGGTVPDGGWNPAVCPLPLSSQLAPSASIRFRSVRRLSHSCNAEGP